MIALYLILGLFFSLPFLWLAVAFWSWQLIIVAFIAALSGCLWFRAVAFSKMLRMRQAEPLKDERMTGVLDRITRSINFSRVKKIQFKFWILSESEAQCTLWVSGSELNVFFTQGLFARANEDQLRALLQSMVESDLRSVRLENRLYALSLWWEELKGQKSQFRYWFISFWLYPLERLLKIAKIEQ